MKTFSILVYATITLILSFLATVPSGTGRSVSPPAGDGVAAPFTYGHAYAALEWQHRLRSFPTGTIPEEWRERALARMDAVRKTEAEKTLSAISWTSLGPDDVGGRVRSIAIDPTNSDIVYCGSVSGGIWKSTNAGASWFPTNDMAANLVIGALAIDPANPNTIYAGTGEGYFNYDALRGAGVLKSTDGGTTYQLLTNLTGSPSGFPYQINDLYIRPDSTNVLYAATNSGVFRTSNGGNSWSYLTKNTGTRRATQIVADPLSPRTFYVAYGNFTTDGIYKTTNGGASFAKLGGGFPTSGFYRISMAIAPGDPSVLYASLTDTATFGTHSIQKSTNGGSTWTQAGTPFDGSVGGTHLGSQGWYNNVIAVSPSDPSVVYAGGINSFKSTSGGFSWTQMTSGTGGGFPSMHVDQHAIAFDPGNPQVIYVGNDGGMYKSTNGGTSFTAINEGLAITQFYSGAAHPSAETYYGGTQDNGTLRTTSPPGWTEAIGGDGGATAVDFATPTIVYTEYIYLNFLKSNNAGLNWFKSMNGLNSWGSGLTDGTSDRVAFIAPFVMDPSDPKTIIAGTYKVYRTTNSATSWDSISTDLTGDGAGGTYDPGSVISALAIAPSAPSTIYAGTTGFGSTASRIQVTTNTGTTWANVTKSPLPNRAVTSFAVDPGNAGRAYAGFSGYNTLGTPGHIFRTTNRGISWTDISGDLPDVPVNALVVDPGDPAQHIVAGTDLGIFETTNGGVNWTEQNTGMARVAVFDLDLRGDGILVAATHGRGMFRSTASVITDVAGEAAGIPAVHRLRQNYPNPFNPSTTITWDIASRARVSLKVFDAAGREVAVLASGDADPGSYSAAFGGADLASGVYFSVLEVGGADGSGSFRDVRKMLLVK